MSLFICVIVFVTALFLVRNEVVYRVRVRRINYIYQHNLKLLDNHRFITDTGYSPFQRLSYEPEQSYDQMLFDFRKWTYKDFFPEEVK